MNGPFAKRFAKNRAERERFRSPSILRSFGRKALAGDPPCDAGCNDDFSRYAYKGSTVETSIPDGKQTWYDVARWNER